MYRSGDVAAVHLEITSQCSARCPQCSRTHQGGTLPGLPEVELSLHDIETILPAPFVRQLSGVYVCGNYGDMTAARDTLPVMRYLRDTNPTIFLQVYSHGSARSADWWRALARLGVECNFAIDGLADTNGIYRQGTSWPLIMRNAAAFIEAGGAANWIFIAFAHNEHQVDAARRLSEELGFKRFSVTRTARFMHNPEKTAIYARDGSVVGVLQPPQRDEYKNDVVEEINATYGAGRFQHPYNEGYLRNTPIACKVAGRRSIYVTAEGYVFPCCYLGKIYHVKPREVARMQREYLDKLPGGLPTLSALDRPITEIIDGTFFQETVPAGWEPDENRNTICARTCGTLDYLGAACNNGFR